MISRFIDLLRHHSDRGRLAALGLATMLSVALGFVFVPTAVAERMIVAGGYYYMLGLFTCFVFYAWRVVQARRVVAIMWLRRPGWVGLALVAATGFAIWADTFEHKILFDEYVLQGTAWHMHATKEIGTPIRAYDFNGTWLAIDTFLDKRPYFFTFLVSLLHDLSGFRLENAYALNVTLAFVCLACTYWLVRAISRRTGPALVAVALLATLPVFGQNATGASMELHNLAMIAIVMVTATLYLQNQDADRLALLVLGTVLLAQSRYESVLFVGPVAVIIVLGWWRAGRVWLPWPAVVAPLLLVPYAWHSRVVDTKPVLWQLRAGDTARFGARYLAGNLEGARNFFFGTSPGQPDSLWLTLLGLGGLVWFAAHFFLRLRRKRAEAHHGAITPAAQVTLLFGGGIAVNLAMLMFYYWSRFDEPITARFALPACLFLAIISGAFVGALELRRLPATRIAAIGLGGWLLIFGFQAYSRRLYTTQNLVMHELNWELEQMLSHPGPVLVITTKATMPFLLHEIPAVNTTIARVRGEQIAWHMRQGTFREVLIAQVLRPTSAEGDAGVDPDDALPDSFRLEPLERKRFGARWIRISRVTEIVPETKSATGMP